MGYEDINGVEGGHCNRKMRFDNMEERAKDLMRKFVNHQISNRDFGKAFEGIRKEYVELTYEHIPGVRRFKDADAPMWLMMFMATDMKMWARAESVILYFENHPEKLEGEYKVLYENTLKQKHNERLRDMCIKMLKNFDKESDCNDD